MRLRRGKLMLHEKDWMIKQQNEQLYNAWTRIEEQRKEIDNLILQIEELRRELEARSKEERLRESIESKHPKSDRSIEWYGDEGHY